MLKKTLVISAIFLLAQNVFAANSANFSQIITDSNVNKSGISIVIKDLESGKDEYKLHANRPINPASTQKIVTYRTAEYVLGKDYEVTTKLYKNNNNEYIIKLGADPLLKSDDLKKLVANIEPNNNGIYIDDSIIDANEWGEGWQWDDDLNPLMPKFSAYNLDNNLIKINLVPTTKGAPATITQDKFYPLSFINETVTGEQNKIKLERKNYIAPDMIFVSGAVKSLTSKNIPINNMKRYFKLSLERILGDEKIDYTGVYKFKRLTPEFTEVASVSHSIEDIRKIILVNSNNMAAESLFKIAASKATNEGSFDNGLKVLNEFCAANNIDVKDIKMVDASGVSKNNLLTAEFLTSFLANPANNDLKEVLPIAGEGTLNNRMTYMADKLHAKTGTLSDTSSIVGYVDTKSGKTYAFSILICDPKSKNADKKMLEEYLIREIYTKL